MVLPALISAGGLVASFLGNEAREDSAQRVQRRVNNANETLAAERMDLSSAQINRLLEQAGQVRANMLRFLARRESEDRAAAGQLAAANMQQAQLAAPQLIQPKSTPGTTLDAQAFGVAKAGQEAQLTDAQLGVQTERAGQAGRAAYDVQGAQELGQADAQVRQNAVVDAARTGAEQAALQTAYQKRMAELGIQQQNAMNAGGELSLAGALGGVIGQGLMANQAYQQPNINMGRAAVGGAVAGAGG